MQTVTAGSLRNLKTVSPRKEPSQKRSQLMVEKILAATMELIETQNVTDITTSQIARQAGISVGSLYQYFPNKESVFYHLWEGKLDQMYFVVVEFDKEPNRSLPRSEFFEQLLHQLQRAEEDVAMNSAAFGLIVSTHPELQELNKQHSDRMADLFAKFFQRYGCRWSKPRLKKFSTFLCQMNASAWYYGDAVGFSFPLTQHLGFVATHALIEECFNES